MQFHMVAINLLWLLTFRYYLKLDEMKASVHLLHWAHLKCSSGCWIGQGRYITSPTSQDVLVKGERPINHGHPCQVDSALCCYVGRERGGAELRWEIFPPHCPPSQGRSLHPSPAWSLLCGVLGPTARLACEQVYCFPSSWGATQLS